MIGAILGDIIGSPYEFAEGMKRRDFPLFSRASCFTDDTVMTVAVAEALMDTLGQGREAVASAAVLAMQKWGRRYPRAGYGGRFYSWLFEEEPRPYFSWGNGSAMRVSPAGWLFDSLEETLAAARAVTAVTHDHPEGIKGAEAVAAAVFLARTGSGKGEIRDYITREFGYDLARSCDGIRPGYQFDVSCQGSVPESVIAFLEGEDYEDTVRLAISLGGDTDTMGCIAGAVAEAYFGVPASLRAEGERRLPEEMLALLRRFDGMKKPREEREA